MEKISEELLDKIFDYINNKLMDFGYFSLNVIDEDNSIRRILKKRGILEESALEKARNLGFYLSKPGNIYVMKTNIIVENIELLIKYYEQVIKELQEKYGKNK